METFDPVESYRGVRGSPDVATSPVADLIALTYLRRVWGNASYVSPTDQEIVIWRMRDGSHTIQSRVKRTDLKWGGIEVAQKTEAGLPEARYLAAQMLVEPERFHELLGSGHQSGPPELLATYERPAGIDDGTLAAAVGHGAPLPDTLAAGEIVRQLWARQDAYSRAAVLRFAENAPFSYGHWTHWKWLYKEAEDAMDREVLTVMLHRLDQAEWVARVPSFPLLKWCPTAATLAYMKRRGRRLLRRWADQDPALHAAVAESILRQDRDDSLDLRTQWISLYILYGGSRRYEPQDRGPRGPYVLRERLRLSHEDSPAPTGWSDEQLHRLLNERGLAWQIQEWAAAALVRRGARVALNPGILPSMLDSPSPFVVQMGARDVISRLSTGSPIGADVAARGYYLSPAKDRRSVESSLPGSTQSAPWRADFARGLARQVADTQVDLWPGRKIDAAILLATRFSDEAEPILVLPGVLRSMRPDKWEIARQLVAGIPAHALPQLIRASGAIPSEMKGAFRDLVIATLERATVDASVAASLVTDPDDAVALTAWAVLVSSATQQGDTDFIEVAWRNVLDAGTTSTALLTAVQSPDAMRLLDLVPAAFALLVEHTRAHPDLLTRAWMPSLVEAILVRDPAVVLAAIPILPEDVWERVRDHLGQSLADPGVAQSFWTSVWGMDASERAGIVNRVLADSKVAATFAAVSDAQFLSTADPQLTPLLVRWIEERSDVFVKGSLPLSLAAAHPVPAVRVAGLTRVIEVGLTLPVALHLLECGLPQPNAVARAYFDSVPQGEPFEVDVALALCDSPMRAVREYGRQWVAVRVGTLPMSELMSRLAEHPDPTMQEIVARAALNDSVEIAALADFDRAVLLGRRRARRAKTLVQTRIRAQPERAVIDTRTLLELARSQTARDADWALQELTRRALAGEVIDGFAVQGPEAGE